MTIYNIIIHLFKGKSFLHSLGLMAVKVCLMAVKVGLMAVKVGLMAVKVWMGSGDKWCLNWLNFWLLSVYKTFCKYKITGVPQFK